MHNSQIFIELICGPFLIHDLSPGL